MRALREKCASQAETIARLTDKSGNNGEEDDGEDKSVDGISVKRRREEKKEEVMTSVGYSLAAARKRQQVNVEDSHLAPAGTRVFINGKAGKVTKAAEGGMYAGKGCGRLDGNREPYVEVTLDDGERVRNGCRTYDIFLDGTRDSPPIFIEV